MGHFNAKMRKEPEYRPTIGDHGIHDARNNI